VDVARRSRRPRAAPCSATHLALALAPGLLAAHVGWAPAGRAASPSDHTRALGRLAVRLDGGLVSATVELGALRRAAGCLLALRAALSLEQNPGPVLAAVPPAGAAGVAGRVRRDWEVHLALQSLRIDVRARLYSHLSEAVRPAGQMFAPKLLGTPRAATLLEIRWAAGLSARYGALKKDSRAARRLPPCSLSRRSASLRSTSYSVTITSTSSFRSFTAASSLSLHGQHALAQLVCINPAPGWQVLLVGL